MNISKFEIGKLNREFIELENYQTNSTMLLEKVQQLRKIISTALFLPAYLSIAPRHAINHSMRNLTMEIPICSPDILNRESGIALNEYLLRDPLNEETLLIKEYQVLDIALAEKEKVIIAQLKLIKIKQAKESPKEISSLEQSEKKKLTLTEIGVLCFYNGRKVTTNNDIAIAAEYGSITKKHTVNTWYNNVSGKSYSPEYLERRGAFGHIKRLEHILESGYLTTDKISTVEKDIEALKKVAENK